MIERSGSIGRNAGAGLSQNGGEYEAEENDDGKRDGVGDGDRGSEILDQEDFNAEGYVNELLKQKGLVDVLKVEGRVVNGMFIYIFSSFLPPFFFNYTSVLSLSNSILQLLLQVCFP